MYMEFFFGGATSSIKLMWVAPKYQKFSTELLARSVMNKCLCFLSAQMFSADITTIYDQLRLPVWMSHGVRGDFVDYRGKERFATHANWQFTVFDSGALPYFEYPQDFAEKMLAFLAQGPGS